MDHEAQEQYENWRQERVEILERYLHIAAENLHVTVVGSATYTGEMRSVGIRGRDDTGNVWLRVAIDDSGELCRWNGNVEANAIQGVPKPVIYRFAEWRDPIWNGGDGIRVRGEVGTYVPDKVVSLDGDIYDDPKLPDSWWSALRAAIVAIQQHPAPPEDFGWKPEYTAEAVEKFFSKKLPMDTFTSKVTWTTAHGDLHWVNVTGPHLWLLDWETWGRAPAWYDAATIYCNSLHHPPTAQKIKDLFPELETHSGMIAQLAVIGRYLWMTENPQAVAPLKALGMELISQIELE